MKYHQIRIVDERHSHICRAINDREKQQGGLTFPFTITVGGTTFNYDEDTLLDGLTVPDGWYHTHLFHNNCRCRIVPIVEPFATPDELDYIPEAIDIARDELPPMKEWDELDEQMMVTGAFAHVAQLEAEMTFGERVAEAVSKNQIVAAVRSTLNRIGKFFRRR